MRASRVWPATRSCSARRKIPILSAPATSPTGQRSGGGSGRHADRVKSFKVLSFHGAGGNDKATAYDTVFAAPLVVGCSLPNGKAADLTCPVLLSRCCRNISQNNIQGSSR